MADELVFSIGALHFGLKEPPGSRVTGAAYLEAVRAALEASSNVEQVRISAPPAFAAETFVVPARPSGGLAETAEGATQVELDELVPAPVGLRIEVDLHIPRRVQADVLDPALRGWVNPGTEHFHAMWSSNWSVPLVVVVPDGPAELRRGQDAVVVVREFLSQELDWSEMLFLDTLGPSPFHADFLVVPSDRSRSGDGGFEFEAIHHERGPDELVFRYDVDSYPDAESALGDIVNAIDDEARFFYETVRGIQNDMDEWSRIEGLVDRLIAQQRAAGMKAWLRRFRSGSRIIDDALIALSQFESNQLFKGQGESGQYRRLFVDATDSYLQRQVDDQIEDRSEYPTRQSAELVRGFERRRAQSSDAAALMASAALGGIVGALLTHFL